MGTVLEVGAAQTVPDNVGYFVHQLPTGDATRSPVPGQVHGASNLSCEALMQGRQQTKFHNREAGAGAVWLKRLKAHPWNINRDYSVYGKKVLHEAQNKR